MDRKTKIAIGVPILATLAGMASLLVPAPSGHSWLGFHIYFGLSLVTAVLYIGASVLFINGLNGFADRLKRAYIFMCIGFSLFGFAQIELPVLISLDLLDSLWRQSGIIALPFVAALVCLYIGARSFAHLFNVRDFMTTVWFYALVPVVLAVLFSFVPHVAISSKEIVFDMSNAVSVWNAFTAGLCAAFMYRVRNIASVAYTNALAWLALTFTLMSATAGVYLVVISIFGDGQTELIAAATLVPLGLAGILLLRSAYAFNGVTTNADVAEKSMARNFFGKLLTPSVDHAASSVDIITQAANMASDYRVVDPILDDLRRLTVTMQPGQPLSESQQSELLRIYLAVEASLLEKESVRVFTKETLRQQIAQKLRLAAGDTSTFWGKLT
jgi:hypothetical protein